MSSEVVWQLGPEILVVVTAVVVYLGGALAVPRASWSWIALAGLGLAGGCLATTEPLAPADPLVIDNLALWTRWLALGLGAILVLLSWQPSGAADAPELAGSLLLVVAGMMLVGAAGELILIFLGLEMISIPTYILLFVGRRTIEGRESAAKYFYLSILASAILLFGLCFLYGAAGSTSIDSIHVRLMGSSPLVAAGRLAVVFLFAGLSFKIAAVPFHFYAPDVYQGSTNSNAALLSVAPKLAGFVVLVRLIVVAAEGVPSHSWRIALALSVLTMTAGNVLALWQDNLRRLLAYSSIAHAGYMLIGLAVAAETAGSGAPVAFDGTASLLFYLLLYCVATLGAFAVLNCLGTSEQPVDHVDGLAGLAWSDEPGQRALAWMLAAFMFSLAGVPPLAGFWGKLALFAGAIGVGEADGGVRAWFVGLAFLAAVNAAIAAAYYLRIVGVMFFRMPLGKVPANPNQLAPLTAATICVLLVLAIGLIPAPWYDCASAAAPAREPAAAGVSPVAPSRAAR